ncbi:MAG: hypothetical protein NDF54_03715 [archaeon GB-1867-035]|nr:hypothetical protein [Candidatus Culexmicrobium profundum]
MEKKGVKRFVFDTGPFLLLSTQEKGSNTARLAVLKHEKGEIEIYIHPNNLSEAYMVINRIRKESTELLIRDVKPEDVIRAAYATLKVINDERTVIELGKLKSKYRGTPWGDLSASALSIRLSSEEEVSIIILDNEKHFERIREVKQYAYLNFNYNPASPFNKCINNGR